MKTVILDFLSKRMLLAYVLCCALSGLTSVAHAVPKQRISESPECVTLLNGHAKTQFRNMGEEISYTNRYIGCWAESLVLRAKTPRYVFIGKGLKLFSNPAFIEALGFSKQLCFVSRGRMKRTDYPCWFERETAQQNVSMEDAARKEAPKILFSDLRTAKDGTEVIEYVLCTNDDPTKPKEYSRGCSRGYKMIITEYGRGDFNNDTVEDVLVKIKYGSNSEERKKCFVAGFTRRDGDLFKMITYGPLGLCE